MFKKGCVIGRGLALILLMSLPFTAFSKDAIWDRKASPSHRNRLSDIRQMIFPGSLKRLLPNKDALGVARRSVSSVLTARPKLSRLKKMVFPVTSILKPPARIVGSPLKKCLGGVSAFVSARLIRAREMRKPIPKSHS